MAKFQRGTVVIEREAVIEDFVMENDINNRATGKVAIVRDDGGGARLAVLQTIDGIGKRRGAIAALARRIKCLRILSGLCGKHAGIAQTGAVIATALQSGSTESSAGVVYTDGPRQRQLGIIPAAVELQVQSGILGRLPQPPAPQVPKILLTVFAAVSHTALPGVTAVHAAPGKPHGGRFCQNMIGRELQRAFLPAAALGTDVAIVATQGRTAGQLPYHTTRRVAPIESSLGALEHLDTFSIEQTTGTLGR